MRRTCLAVLAALTLASSVALSGAPASAAPTVAVQAKDAKNDVKMLSGGLNKAQRTSIDIRKVTITEYGAKVRFAVKLKAITSSKKFDQMVFIRLIPKGTTTDSGDIGFSPQAKDLGYASRTNETTFDLEAVCDPLIAKSRPGKKLTFLDVPKECIPDGKVKIKMTTYTGIFRSDAPPYSKDAFKVPGRHDLIS